MKSGVSLALCYPGQPLSALDAVLEVAATSGIEAIELVPHHDFPDPLAVTLEERRAIRRRVERHGLRILGLCHVLAGYPSLGWFAGDATRNQTRQLIREQIKLCQELGGEVLTLGSGTARALPPNFPAPSAHAWAAELLESLVPIAESRRIVLALDPLPAQEADFLHSPDEGVALVRRVRHPLVRMTLNFRALYAAGLDVAQLVPEHLPFIAHLHVPEGSLRVPSQAAAGVRVLPGRDLARAGFRGWATLIPDAKTGRRAGRAELEPGVLEKFAVWGGR